MWAHKKDLSQTDWRPPSTCVFSEPEKWFLPPECLFPLLIALGLLAPSLLFLKQMNFFFFLFLPAIIPPCSFWSSPNSWKNSSCLRPLCLYCLSEFWTLTLIPARHLYLCSGGYSQKSLPPEILSFLRISEAFFPNHFPTQPRVLQNWIFCLGYILFSPSLSSLLSYVIEPILPSVDMHGITEWSSE